MCASRYASSYLCSHRFLSVVFFFSRHCDPRDLHSFPTRRSSDLLPPVAAGRRCRRASGRSHVHPHARAQPAPGRRSEEHTSELQSLRHLVCRLLLEKKKINKQSGVLELRPPPALSETQLCRTTLI